MRKKEIFFMPLGGAERVGASCYYLRLGSSNVLLDCGAQANKTSLLIPDFKALLTSHYMDSFSQLDHVYISHAHNDHMSYLPELMQLAPEAAYYMTPLTKQLSEYRLQLRQKSRLLAGADVERLLAGCAEVSYLQTLEHKDYRVTFYPAGHIPGAMMTLFEYQGRRILYTGDYSLHSRLGSCWLPPENMQIDVLLLCGLHAMQPGYRRKENALDYRIEQILACLSSNRSVYMQVMDDSRVIEVLLALNAAMRKKGMSYPVYLEAEAMQAVEALERLQLPVLESNNYSRLSAQSLRPHVVLGRRAKEQVPWEYQVFDSNYTLHEDYPEMKQFIKRINPRQAYIVHYQPMNYSWGQTIEQELMYDADCRTQVTFAEAGHGYII